MTFNQVVWGSNPQCLIPPLYCVVYNHHMAYGESHRFFVDKNSAESKPFWFDFALYDADNRT